MKSQLIAIVAAVLVVGCGPSTPDIDIHQAATDGNIKAVKQHLAAGADTNVRDGQGMTPLHWAAQYGHKEIVELLIAKGADVNAKNTEGARPLDMTMTKPKIAALLRKNGAKHSEVFKKLMAEMAE